jgi:phospholipid/cholesterol/gamma-HCH transport system substrate-binding protein
MSFLQAAEFKVGMMVLSVAGLIGYMSMQLSDDPSILRRPKKAWFLLPNASGLIKNGAVKTAGIQVGTVKDITLQDGLARVEVTVKADVPLFVSAAVEIKSMGILGDKHVEIFPGSPTDATLEDGGQILIIRDKGSLDNIINQVGDIAADLKDVTKNLREAVSEDGTSKHILGRIVRSIEKLTADLAQITTANKEKVNDIIDQVHNITTSLDEMINEEGEQGLRKTWKRTLARIDSTMKNVDEITTKVNKGEGTIGKLINDETTVEELNTAIQGVSSLVDTASRIQTGFDYHAEYLSAIGGTKSYIGIQIQPGLDRYYMIGLVDDPAGVVDESSARVTDNVSGGTVSDTRERKVYKNKTKLTILYAMNFWDLTLRGGMIESSGGFGVDYSFFKRKLKLSMDVFNLEKANLRAFAKYNVGLGFYVLGGISDALDKSSVRSGYLGAGLFLTNDDLKVLLTRSPF